MTDEEKILPIERLLRIVSDLPTMICEDLRRNEILQEIGRWGFFGQTARRDANGFFVNVPAQTPKPENDFIIARRNLQPFDEVVPEELGSQIFGVRFVEYGTDRIFLEVMRGITNERGSELLFSAGIVGWQKQENMFRDFFQRSVAGEEVKELIGEIGIGRQIKTFVTRAGLAAFLDDFCLFLDESVEKQQMTSLRAGQIKEAIDGIKQVGILKNPETIVTESHMRVDLKTETVWARDQVTLKEYNLLSLASTPAQVEQTKKLIRQLISGAKCAHESGKEEACFYTPLPSVNGMSAVSSGKIPVNEFIFDSQGNVQTIIIYAPPSNITIQEYEKVLNEILLTVGWRISPRPTEFSYTDDGPMPADKLAEAIVRVLDKHSIGNAAYKQKMLQQAVQVVAKQNPIDRQLPIILVQRIPLVDLHPLLSFTRPLQTDGIIDFSSAVFLGATTTLFTDSIPESSSDVILSAAASIDFPQTALIQQIEYEIDDIDNQKIDNQKFVGVEIGKAMEHNLIGLVFEEEKSMPGPTDFSSHLELPTEEPQNSKNGEEMKRQEIDHEAAQRKRTRDKVKEASQTIRTKIYVEGVKQVTTLYESIHYDNSNYRSDVQRQEKAGRIIKEEKIIEKEENVLAAKAGRTIYRRKRDNGKNNISEVELISAEMCFNSLANKPADTQTLAEDADRRVCGDKGYYGYKHVILINDNASVRGDEFRTDDPNHQYRKKDTVIDQIYERLSPPKHQKDEGEEITESGAECNYDLNCNDKQVDGDFKVCTDDSNHRYTIENESSNEIVELPQNEVILFDSKLQFPQIVDSATASLVIQTADNVRKLAAVAAKDAVPAEPSPLQIPLLNLITPPKIIIDENIGVRFKNLPEVQAQRIWEMFLRIYHAIESEAEFIRGRKQKKHRVFLRAKQEIARSGQLMQNQTFQYAQILGIMLICVVKLAVIFKI